MAIEKTETVVVETVEAAPQEPEKKESAIEELSDNFEGDIFLAPE